MDFDPVEDAGPPGAEGLLVSLQAVREPRADRPFDMDILPQVHRRCDQPDEEGIRKFGQKTTRFPVRAEP